MSKNSIQEKSLKKLNLIINEILTTEHTYKEGLKQLETLCVRKATTIKRKEIALTDTLEDLNFLDEKLSRENVEYRFLIELITNIRELLEGIPDIEKFSNSTLNADQIEEFYKAFIAAYGPSGSLTKKTFVFAAFTQRKDSYVTNMAEFFKKEDPIYWLSEVMQDKTFKQTMEQNEKFFKGVDTSVQYKDMLTQYIGSRLQLPVQRFPRYELFIKELIQALIGLKNGVKYEIPKDETLKDEKDREGVYATLNDHLPQTGNQLKSTKLYAAKINTLTIPKEKEKIWNFPIINGIRYLIAQHTNYEIKHENEALENSKKNSPHNSIGEQKSSSTGSPENSKAEETDSSVLSDLDSQDEILLNVDSAESSDTSSPEDNRKVSFIPVNGVEETPKPVSKTPPPPPIRKARTVPVPPPIPEHFLRNKRTNSTDLTGSQPALSENKEPASASSTSTAPVINTPPPLPRSNTEKLSENQSSFLQRRAATPDTSNVTTTQPTPPHHRTSISSVRNTSELFKNAPIMMGAKPKSQGTPTPMQTKGIGNGGQQG